MLIYNLLENSSNYSDRTGSLWFYYKYEEANINAIIEDNDNFKSFKYKTKLIESTNENGILENVAIAVPLKYLGTFLAITWNSIN